MYASGGTPEHSGLAANVIQLFGAQLAGKPCRIFTSDLRVRVLETGLATHQDVSVVCGSLERDPDVATGQEGATPTGSPETRVRPSPEPHGWRRVPHNGLGVQC